MTKTNPIAKDLRSPKYRKQVVKSKKVYSRVKAKQEKISLALVQERT